MKSKKLLLLICLALILTVTLTLVACNKPTTYTVTFSGEGIETITQTVKAGQCATAPADVTKTGYDAVWKKNGEKFDFATPIHSDVELTLSWEGKKYTVTLNAGGGATDEPTKQVTFGSPYNLGIATTQDEDYIFGGWAVNGTAITSGTGESLNVWDIAEDTTVTAIWKENPLAYTLLENDTYSVSAKQESAQVAPFNDAIVIPSEYKGKAVTVIGSMKNLTSYEIKVPSSITEISANAFANNNYVDIVDLSDFTGKIGEKAFYNSGIKIIDLGKTTEIGNSAFADSEVSVIAVPATVTKIGDNAFNSMSIMEVGFAGVFPTLGQTVFGDGRRGDDDKISVIATTEAWETLTNITMDDENSEAFNAAVTEKTGLVASYMRNYTEDEMAESVATEGILREQSDAADRKVVYRGIGLTAVFYDYSDAYLEEMYEASHFYHYLTNEIDRDTYVLDYTNKSVIMVEKNAKGEVIYDNVLYDYQGSEIVYYVPENITKIAGGAAFGNTVIRFAMIGDNVTEIGPFAFAMNNLFGVTIGGGIETIGEYAFFGNEYLQQIVFKGSTPPAIGTAAFCMMIGTGGIGPILRLSDISMYTDCYVYADLPVDDSGWWPITDKSGFVAAFNASLDDISDLLPNIDGDPAIYETSNFEKSSKSGSFYSEGNQIELEEGTITMMGTASTGYAIVHYDEEKVGYVHYTNIPGYTSSADPKAIQMFMLTSEGITSTFVYGKFESKNDGYTFVYRGGEAGSYGEIGSDNFTFDGYGKFTFFAENGATVDGTYTANGNVLTLSDDLGTVTVDKDNKTINYNSKVMTALGEGAGIYYDASNAAKLTVDGKAYADGTKQYDGKMTIVYKNQSTTVGYKIVNNQYVLTLNGKERTWSYSRTSSSYVFQGYYGPGDSENYLSFNIMESGYIGSFANGRDTLSLDGYFTATLGAKTGVYAWFGGDDDTLLINFDNETVIIKTDKENETFEQVTVQNEIGKWYTTTSSNYAWYFDGYGNVLYYDGTYHNGTYEFDSATGDISIIYNGSPVQNNEKGTLNIASGTGKLVYNNYGNSYCGISRVPFEKFGSSSALYAYSFIAKYDKTANKIISTSPSFSIYKSGNNLFISVYGRPSVIVSINGELNGLVCEFEYTVVKDDVLITATYEMTITQTDGSYKATVAAKDFVDSAMKSKDGTTTYNVSWVDNNHVVIWTMGSWGGSVYAMGEVADGITTTDFTIVYDGETYNVTGHGTENAVIEKVVTAQE